ncbi:MAG: phosphatidate cytidylyltransferase [Streblomastix strix]|uniref:Phosphatidate cytidylyltransferase n=1 Tax=Streblomastix strix TaxID=222440 RepID=A0A5J4WJB6_9EUKA|nr:MAG: phosphatidate cytidylyltransferase [Streblomastix strix]
MSINHVEKITVDKGPKWVLRWAVGLPVAFAFFYSVYLLPILFRFMCTAILIPCSIEFDNFVIFLELIDIAQHKFFRILFISFAALISASSIFIGDYLIHFTILFAGCTSIIIGHIISEKAFNKETLSPKVFYHLAIQILGLVWATFGLSNMLMLNHIDTSFCFFCLTITFTTDTMSMVIGKPFGKHKMFKSLSPNKSWEGFFGGIFGGALFQGSIILPLYGRWRCVPTTVTRLQLVVLEIITAFFVQLGDLTQSYFKRIAGIKDSGNFFPGHGGALDRVCGFTFSAAFVVLLLKFMPQLIHQ